MDLHRAGVIGAGIGGAVGAIAANTMDFGAITVGLVAGLGAILSYLMVLFIQKFQDNQP